MAQEKPLPVEILTTFPAVDEAKVDALLKEELKKLTPKIVVLDDDPTGVQTVHDISVYTDWTVDTLVQGFEEPGSMFFVLTNSRGMTVPQSTAAHKEIAQNVFDAAQKTGKEYILISRSDSTLRGHYPLETQILREETERLTGKKIDGEIMLPFFQEGGRFTIGNVHYVKEGDQLTPAAMTEFAKDKSFGYTKSHLGEYCEEKSVGLYRASDMTYLSLEEIRSLDLDGIEKKLMNVTAFGKVIVSAIAVGGHAV